MIITKLNGGLGNQLFEYAYARNLQIKYADRMALDTEGFKRSDRHYSLENFVLSKDVEILPHENCRKLIVWQALSKINRKCASKLASFFNVYLWKSSYYRNFQVENTRKGMHYFYGYWQSEKYFEENKEQIRQELRVKTPYLSESLRYLPEAEQPNSVAVHIRRGDYVSCGMILCDEKYYLNGMKYIKEKYADCNYLIFTDDIQWVKENIHFEYPVTYVDIDNPDYEVLRLMYMCKHFVMSNSSFSWWAQYLSDNENKIVVAPSVWYPDGHGDRSIYLDNWTILKGDLSL